MAETSDYDELGPIPFVDGGSTLGDVIFGGVTDEVEGSGEIPYTTVFKTPVPFKSHDRHVFIPGQPFRVRISNHQRSMTKHILNPNLYTIELEHGPFSWTIYKRYKHIFHLHNHLKLFRASLNIPFPSFEHRKQRQTIKEGKSGISLLPRLPLKPEVMVGYDEIEDRALELEQYLEALLNIPFFRNNPETIHFLSVSHLSFVKELGSKSIEGLIKKQTGSTRRGCYCFGCCECIRCTRLSHVTSDLCGCWRERWLVVKDTWLAYIRPRDSALRGVILFDQAFEISSGLYSSGIQVYNMQRRVVFKCNGRRKRTDWCDNIMNVSKRQGFGFTQRNKNSSFAPPRRDTIASWFVDGSAYMSAVADAVVNAKEEIYIADWWLSPEIYLKRPSLHGHEWRLDCVLQRKAAEGVKIFVLLYKEVELALGINSYYSKTVLSKCNKSNIKVLRHPDHANSGVFLWAHHEKILCVDQTIAFIGGIDLCYGRWDDHEHRLVDYDISLPRNGDHLPLKKITSSRPLGNKPQPLVTLVQQSNAIGLSTVTFQTTGNGDLPEVEVVTEDYVESVVAQSLEEVVPPVIDEEDEVIDKPEEHIKCDSPEFQRKSIFRKLQDSVQETSKSLLQKVTGDEDDNVTEVKETEETVEVKIIQPVEKSEISDEIDGFIMKSMKFWLGKDYCNFIVKDFCDLDSPYKDLVDRNRTPRMPWHDVGGMVHGAAARDVARHFIQRWNATKLEKAKNVDCYPYLLPKSYEHFDDPLPMGSAAQYRVNCQVLRSVSSWSAGFLDPNSWEESIHEAYITSIAKAQHYIYIENQFFISLARQNPNVKNQIAEALCKRIVKAHRENKTFRVFVVIPLLPGFMGEVGGPSGTALHAITHWNYASICRGPDSLISRLEEQGVSNPFNYITFHGLRNHSVLHGEPVTELIYVHSKLMIVDDNLVICGSANINDRSLLGKRDSEIAVIIQDEEMIDGVMNGEITAIGQYASSLRKHIFSEHLGLLDTNVGYSFDVTDPTSDSFYNDVWKATSTSNTEIFEEVFQCLPSDKVQSFTDLGTFHGAMPLLTVNPSMAATKIASIKGHIVDLPLDFLKNETLTPNPKSVEGMMPTALWT